MRRPNKSSSAKLSADSQRLVMFAQAVIQAASRLEERAWERHLDAQVQKLLKSNHQDSIDAALDELFKQQSGAYDALMEALEAGSESCRIDHDNVAYDALLVAMPILAWTRFSIASGQIPADMLTTLGAHLHAHVLASDVRMAMAPTLFSIDQLPRSHVETLALTQRLAQAALKGGAIKPAADAPETAPFLADTRYVLAAIVAPAGEPLFHWQSGLNLSEREIAFNQWRNQATPNIAKLLPGCGVELLMPEAYYVACREADKQIRPASINAAVHYLTHTLGTDPSELAVSIGSFSEDTGEVRTDEYRVGFTHGQEPEVIYGIVWPLYGEEDDDTRLTAIDASGRPTAPEEISNKTPLEQIITLLQSAGVTRIKQHDERFAMEFCDDCGAPLYPDMDAELVHAEMPEDAPQGQSHLH
ncbi:MAG TPA: DUF2863 family protein [Burkholderiaceae bacterium]|nr:DUF2863 family protein [Burkholderiaceae bacterium]